MSYGFPSLVRAELFRIRRQRSNWLLPLVPLAGLAVLAALTITSYGLTDLHGKAVLDAARDLTDTASLVLEMSLGIPVLLIAARTAAHDFQYGAIRILIGGGARRVALVLSKLAASGLVATGGLVIGLVVAAGCVGLLSPAIARHIGSLPPVYWHELWLDVAAIAISIGCCLILGTFTSTLSRSLTAGVTAAMVWFPTENVLTAVLAFAVATTHQDVFVKASGWLLAANLNHLTQALQPWRSTIEMGAKPLGETSNNPVGPVGAEQCLIVIGLWAALMLLTSLVSVIGRIDVKG